MVDLALKGGAVSVSKPSDRVDVLKRLRLNDLVFRILTRSAAIAVLIILGGIIISLVHGAWPALAKFGFGFLVSDTWNPVTEKFGAVAPIYGTLVTSAVAGCKLTPNMGTGRAPLVAGSVASMKFLIGS